MPRDTDIVEISQVFLSATAEDCKVYREAVRDYVQAHLKAAKIFLQETWAEAGRKVVDVCEERVKTSDAYLGLFGYRYGWVPPGHTKSITELEFAWALERWPRAPSPIFVMLPVKASEADKELRERAQVLLVQEFPDEAQRDQVERQLLEFHASVHKWAEAGLMLEFYRDRMDLLGKALGCLSNWNLDLLRGALKGRRQTVGDIPAEELGRIGSRNQRELLQKILEMFTDRQNERTLAVLVHGPENHGQRELAEFLARWEEWDGMEVYCGQPPEIDSTGSLTRWLCSQLREPVPGGASIDALAAVLSARLAHTSVVVLLRSIGEQPERLDRFQTGFWEPLRSALALRSPGGRGRLYCVLFDHQALPADPGPAVRTSEVDDDTVDYGQLLALPPLGAIKTSQVRTWLKELKSTGIVLDEARREDIAQRVTRQSNYPPNIYDRLAREGFWATAT